MAGKTAILSVRIIGDAVEAVGALGDVDSAAGRSMSKLDKASLAATGVLTAITAIGTQFGDAASDMEQAVGAVDAVFKGSADQVHQWADSAATDVGLASDEYSNMATILAAQLKNMGIPMEQVSGKTKDLIGLGADLSAQYGGSTSDAVEALSSLLRGERDPIERYGVSINQAAVNAEKAKLGLSGLTGEADKNANLQATLALLTQQTADAQGAFGRETDTTAHKQQVANAEWQNAKIALGEAFLPVLSGAADMLGDVSGLLKDNAGAVDALLFVLGGLALGILIVNGAMKAYEAGAAVATAAQWLWNVAMDANPISLIVIAIGLVIAIVAVLIANWDKVAAVAGDVWGVVIDWVKQVGDWFGSIFDSIGDWWDGLVSSWQDGINDFIGWIQDALNWLGQITGFNAVSDWVGDVFGGSSSSASTDSATMSTDATPMLMRANFSTLTAKTLAAPASSTTGALARRGQTAGDTYNITVNGALDPDAVAAQVGDILRRRGARRGASAAAGAY
jgi:hypothetical protein